MSEEYIKTLGDHLKYHGKLEGKHISEMQGRCFRASKKDQPYFINNINPRKIISFSIRYFNDIDKFYLVPIKNHRTDNEYTPNNHQKQQMQDFFQQKQEQNQEK